ncbi:adenylate kinase, partial [Pseudomonas sp. GW456-E6]|uniref:adenylate kinase family protein n=1 Tax=Pseudomonas sp. GW456-E6 TaxID=2070591 RepID=UPI000CA87F79
LESKLNELGRQVSAAVLFEVSDAEVVRRLGGRRTCTNGHIFHVDSDPPKNEGVCDVCGASLEVRDDDEPAVIRHRLDEYHSKT